jgi:hypothetical protein
LNTHFIDVTVVINTISRELPCRELPYAIQSNISVRKSASVRDAAPLFCGYRRLSLIFLFKANPHYQTRQERRIIR